MYRNPTPPQRSPESSELDEYEQKFLRSARRKRQIMGLVGGLLAIFCLGTCTYPFAKAIGTDLYDSQHTKLTKDEASRVTAAIDPLDDHAKKSQAAFEAAWPKMRAGDIGARRDLGSCEISIPGPTLSKKEGSVSIGDSSGGAGWTFVDLTPATARSPLADLKMPNGSIPSANYPGAPMIQLPPYSLHLTAPEAPPTLSGDWMIKQIADIRAGMAKGVRRDSHKSFVSEAEHLASDGLDVNVVVFVDSWTNPSFSGEVAKPTKEEQDDAFDNGQSAPKAKRIFDMGYAFARAFAWDPNKLAVVCASQAVGLSSPDITFMSNNFTPLQQDLVLQLERSLQRSFVAVGDAPPKLEKPMLLMAADEPADAGAPPPKKKKKRR